MTNEEPRNGNATSSPCVRNSTSHLRIDVSEDNAVGEDEKTENHLSETNVTSPGISLDKTAYLLLTTNGSSERFLLLELIREMVVATWKFLLHTETVRAFEFAGDRHRSDEDSGGVGMWDVLRSSSLVGNYSDSRYDARREDTYDPADEILVVGNNSYMSVSNYRSSVLPILVGEPVLRLPCPSGLRMPNSTDCFKYYVCNATRGQLFTFSCPSGMAFNAFKRICDVQSAEVCVRNVSGDAVPSSPTNPPINEQLACSKNGKIPDPESPRNYYVCVSRRPSEPFRKLKFSCPEGLVFCNKGKVCKEAVVCPDYMRPNY